MNYSHLVKFVKKNIDMRRRVNHQIHQWILKNYKFFC